jgi:murein DD-endopeptidase MepM/ murein hydrolase activator NlpD
MPDHVSHIILLPQGADWEWYKAIRNYVLHFRVTVTQSADDAGSFHGTSHTITVIDVPDGWPGDIVTWLHDNYPNAKLDVISVATPSQTAYVLDKRVAQDDRYGAEEGPQEPDVPDVPDVPDIPDIPDVPDVPDTPDVPDVPGEADFIWPTAGVEARVNQRFAANPWIYRKWPQLPGHEGIDVLAPEGTDVLACADGRIHEVDTAHPDQPDSFPYGNFVQIEHRIDGLTWRTTYAHLNQVVVNEGQAVSQGDKIGASGATGNVRGEEGGAHLHLTMAKEGAQTDGYLPGLVDPEAYLTWPDGHRLTPDASLPHIYGMHQDTNREMAALMRDNGIKGYIVWSEGIGDNPDEQGGGDDYADLTTDFGHTPIVRLNNGYQGAGTLPRRSRYDAFAHRCANWVSRSRGANIWVIGNEMNNPGEHPEGERISAEAYAECFNRVYAAIKNVQPNAIVTTGAVDPTNAAMGDCRDYFLTILENVDAVDAIALHAYSHGPEPWLVVSDQKFEHAPLTWQYYHFRMFETFMEAIPERLQHLPVYITETNHLEITAGGAHGWVDQNEGWIWAMYQRVDEWNRRGGQQVLCSALYRYPQVDEWVIRGKGLVIEDFRQAMGMKYRPYVRWP